MGRILYEFDGETLRLQMRGLSNHEVRTVMLGFWARLSEEDRTDFIRELYHYQQLGGGLPALAQMIADAP
jgi:hypothetical protein